MYDGARLLILFAILACAAVYLIRFFRDGSARKKCTASAVGSYRYSNEKSSGSSRYETFWTPVYEYTADDTFYLVEIPKNGPNWNSFPIEVEIEYDPDNPEICFAMNMRGKIISRYTKEDENI